MRSFHREFFLNYRDTENNFWKEITCIPAIAMPRNTNMKLSHCNQFVTFLRQPWKYIASLGYDGGYECTISEKQENERRGRGDGRGGRENRIE